MISQDEQEYLLSDERYLIALKTARIKILEGAQSYSIGSRSLTRADLGAINREIAKLQGATTPRFRRIRPVDW